MKLFDVYPLYDINPIYGDDVWIYDKKGEKYLDLYGGHAVISIGHNRSEFTDALKNQIEKLVFYSNAVENDLQREFANQLGIVSGLKHHSLFLCSSGAEAVENALKLASFHTHKKRIVAFKNGFHGRTSAAVAASDFELIKSDLNKQHRVDFVDLEDFEGLFATFDKEDVAACIIEPIQGVGGLDQPSEHFFKTIEKLCKETGSCLIIDEIQSGCGRTGRYFAHQHYDIRPDLITIAKGIGNGFPVGGVIIDNKIKARYGLLGTTYGGNHLACSAGISVLNVLSRLQLMDKIPELETHFRNRASKISSIKKVKGRGLMLGLEFDFEVSKLRENLLYKCNIFTGGSSNKKLLRILPPLTLQVKHIDQLFSSLEQLL